MLVWVAMNFDHFHPLFLLFTTVPLKVLYVNDLSWLLDVCNNLLRCSVQTAVSIHFAGVFEPDLQKSFIELLPQCHRCIECVGEETGAGLVSEGAGSVIRDQRGAAERMFTDEDVMNTGV